MAAQEPCTEQDLEESFKDDPKFALELLNADYGDMLLRYIKKHAIGLQHADWKDIYQTTFVEIWRATQKPDFDYRKPLALVFRIAKCRVIDTLRKRKIETKDDADAILTYLAKDFDASDNRVKLLYPDGVVWEEFTRNLHEVVSALPQRQQIVARLFIENYEDLRERDTYAPLADKLSEITGKCEGAVAVKSAWNEARQKIATEMARCGFNFLKTE